MEGTQSQRRKSTTKPAPTSFATAVTPAKKSLEWLVGRRIKVKTALDEEIEGLIYTSSEESRQARKNLAFRILKISHIKEILVVASEEAATLSHDPAVIASKPSSYLPITPINIDGIRHREEESLRKMKQEAAKRGVGVTAEAQAIFDALAKTLPCHWSNDTIVVLNEIHIPPPYDVGSCKVDSRKSNNPSTPSLARVKKVLEGERQRLASSKK